MPTLVPKIELRVSLDDDLGKGFKFLRYRKPVDMSKIGVSKGENAECVQKLCEINLEKFQARYF
jgi:hypothetical protein